MNLEAYEKIIKVIEEDIDSLKIKIENKYLSDKNKLKVSKKLSDLETKIKKLLTDKNTPKELTIKKAILIDQLTQIKKSMKR